MSDSEETDGRPIEYCQRVRRLTDTGRAYTAATTRQTSKCGYAVDRLVEAGEEGVQERPGDKHSGKIYRRHESAEVVFAEWPVIESVSSGVVGVTRDGN